MCRGFFVSILPFLWYLYNKLFFTKVLTGVFSYV